MTENKTRIFFLTTDNNAPSGGRFLIYQLVDILIKNGYDAYALHQKTNFRYTWFQNQTPVRYTYQIKKQRIRSSKLKHWCRIFWSIFKDKLNNRNNITQPVIITNDDILVLPATRTSFCHEILPGVPKISLSQGPYLLLQCGGLDDPDNSIFHSDIKGRIAMSKLNYNLHCMIFKKETVWEVPVFLDKNLYSYTPSKKHQIAYMPRKLPKDSLALINLLKLRDNLNGFNFIPIDKMTPQQVASTLNDSLIFLSFSHREGFGLPPAEAMACGCIVIGYSGNGGDEFFDEKYCFPIKDGDLLSFAMTIENIIEQYNQNENSYTKMTNDASNYILEKYSQKKTEEKFMTAWKKIIGCI